MAPDRTVSSYRITRSGTAHRVLRSELNDYDFKFKVSLLTLLPPKIVTSPKRPQGPTPVPPGARIDGLVPWKYGGETARN